MATTKVLVYWVEETNWSIVSESALRDDVLPGQRTFTKYQGKWYPSLVIAKDDQKAIDRAETSFSIFVKDCIQSESPNDVENCILREYIHARTKEPKVVKVKPNVEPSRPSSVLAPCSSTLIPALPKEPKVVEAQTRVKPSQSSSDQTFCSSTTLIPFVTMGSTSTDSPDSPVNILKESKSERRIRKLEEDVKYMRRKIRKLEERFEKDIDTVQKKDTNKVDQDTEKNVDLVIKKVDVDTGKKVDTLTDNDLDEKQCETESTGDLVERKYNELKVNGMKTDKEKLKYLVSWFFTNEELINHSRTGKKSPKSGCNGARPPLNGRAFEQLTDAVAKNTKFDLDTFIKKFENIQKVLRR